MCLLAWIEADPSSDQQHWGWLKSCLGVRSSIQKIGNWLYLLVRLELGFGGINCGFDGVIPTALTSFEQCYTFSSQSGLVRLMFFLHISSPMSKYVKQYWTLDGNSTYISGVKCILRQYAFRPCVNLSCDYEIVFTIASRAAWNGSHVIVNVFHLLFVFELPLQQWICFPCACNCASFVWKCDRHFAIYSARSLEIQLSLPSVRRTILLPSSSECVSYIVFSNVRVSKTVFFGHFLVIDRNDFEMTEKI